MKLRRRHAQIRDQLAIRRAARIIVRRAQEQFVCR